MRCAPPLARWLAVVWPPLRAVMKVPPAQKAVCVMMDLCWVMTSACLYRSVAVSTKDSIIKMNRYYSSSNVSNSTSTSANECCYSLCFWHCCLLTLLTATDDFFSALFSFLRCSIQKSPVTLAVSVQMVAYSVILNSVARPMRSVMWKTALPHVFPKVLVPVLWVESGQSGPLMEW